MGLNCYKIPALQDPILETPNISYLQDRYTLGDQLGWGQFGVIRSCSDLLTSETLACKSIAKDRLVSSDDLRSLKLEIEIMARLAGHPNVVDLKAVYEEEEFVHLVMELCAGGELFHRIEQCGRFEEEEARWLFEQLMEVVVYCHENGIVHRDLKPENVLLATRSSSSPIKLADFGLATYVKPGQSLSGTVGSPFYIAPEVLAGGYNEAADVWSAGVILYILLSGMPPFWGKTKSQIFESVRSAELRFPSEPWNGVSESAKDLVRGMLQRDPSLRLTAKEVLEHSWFKNISQRTQSSCRHGGVINYGQEHNSGSCSFSTLNVRTTRDVSFGLTSPIFCHNQPDPSSPTFTCQSSFSTFYNDTTPSPSTNGFSFHNSCDSNEMEVSPQIALIPSFSFFCPSPTDEQELQPLAFKTDSSKANTVLRDSTTGKISVPMEPGHDITAVENKETEFKKGAFSTTSRTPIRSRRNHTISLGEHLDVIVTESVIRWASCTHLPSAPSLRSSLVC